jgi:amidase
MVVAADGLASMEGDGERETLAPAVARAAALLNRAEDVTVAPDGLVNWQLIYRTVQGREAWRNHGQWIETRKPKLNPAVAVRFAAAKSVSENEYEVACARREEISKRVRGILRDDTVIVLPAMPGIAPLRDATEESFEAYRTRAVSLNCIAGLAGCPQISLPLATFNGAPIGLGVIAPPGRDRALIALARRIMEA